MQYLIGDKKFSFSYQELKDEYYKICSLSDEQFIENLNDILHFTCFVGWFKEIGRDALLSDEGILHELIHLLSGVETVNELKEIRKKFDKLMYL